MLYAMGKGEDKGTLTPIVVAFIAACASIAVAVIGLSRKTDASLHIDTELLIFRAEIN
jgi:hypothetical protein